MAESLRGDRGYGIPQQFSAFHVYYRYEDEPLEMEFPVTNGQPVKVKLSEKEAMQLISQIALRLAEPWSRDLPPQQTRCLITGEDAF